MEEFSDLLRFDPLQAAEGLTGESYKDDKETMVLGIGLMQAHAKAKREELALRMDTHSDISFAEAVTVFENLGFEEVLSETSAHGDDAVFFKVFWRDGVLLTADSYARTAEHGGYVLNSCNFYYNWVPDDREDRFAYTSSGHFMVFRDGRGLPMSERSAPGDEWVWVGSHDGREAIRHNLSQLEAHGTILPSWKDNARPWLVTYTDEDDPANVDSDGRIDYEKVIQSRIARLPEAVRKAVNVPNALDT